MNLRPMTELTRAARQILDVLGLTAPGTRLRFMDNGRPGEEHLSCFYQGRYTVPSFEGLRALGVSFLNGDTLTP